MGNNKEKAITKMSMKLREENAPAIVEIKVVDDEFSSYMERKIQDDTYRFSVLADLLKRKKQGEVFSIEDEACQYFKSSGRYIHMYLNILEKGIPQLRAQPFKRTAHLNWASCNINTRAKSQQRIKLNIDEDLYGNIFWDIRKKRWDCKRDKKSTQLFAEINMTNLEEQVLHRYGHRYNASNMDELGANWLREKKEKEKNKKSA